MKNLSNIEHELDIVTKQYVDNAADTKVDKIEGKQLSTNDFSNEDKEKLNSLENYTLPTASADALGGVKIGNDLTIDENGILNIDNIDYTKIENKPTLNGITIEGDKVGTDYGINDTNVYYGTEEPTAENVVMWVDPSGSDAITGDKLEQIEEQINVSNSYQELALEKIDHTYNKAITRNMCFNINSFSKGASTLTGQATSSFYDNGSQPTMTISTNLKNGWYLYNTESSGYDVINNTATGTATISGINTAFNRTAYNSNSAVYFISGSSTKAYAVRTFLFDFKTARNVTLKWYSGGDVDSFTFYGSNDNSTWTPIDTFAKNNAISITSETAYRYYKIENASVVYSNMYLYYMYFVVNDTQTIPDFENAYTYNGDITSLKQILVKTPNTLDMTSVTTNTINGFTIENLLEENKLYELSLIDNQIKVLYEVGKTKVVAGSFTTVTAGSIDIIELGFQPDLVICYNTANNGYMISSESTVEGIGYDEVPKIFSRAYSHSDGKIINNGFQVKAWSDNKKIYYVAIKL